MELAISPSRQTPEAMLISHRKLGPRGHALQHPSKIDRDVDVVSPHFNLAAVCIPSLQG